MNLRFVERRIPDSCRIEKVLQMFIPELIGPEEERWVDVPLIKLPEEYRESSKVGPI